MQLNRYGLKSTTHDKGPQVLNRNYNDRGSLTEAVFQRYSIEEADEGDSGEVCSAAPINDVVKVISVYLTDSNHFS